MKKRKTNGVVPNYAGEAIKVAKPVPGTPGSELHRCDAALASAAPNGLPSHLPFRAATSQQKTAGATSFGHALGTNRSPRAARANRMMGS